MNIFPAMVHGRVADQRKTHLSQVMSPNSSSLKTSSPEELSLTGILGQIRVKYRKDSWGITTKLIAEDMEGFGKVAFDMSYVQSQMHSDHDSAESIADSDLEDGELQKVLASPLYVQGRENCNSSRIPTAPGKLSAIIQEREVSAKRTQADRRESLMSSSSQEPRASGKSAAMSSSGSAEPRNQFKSSIFKNADPSNVGRSLLEGIKDHLLSQARSDLAKQELQVEPLNNWSASFSNKLMLKDWNYRTHNMDMLNLDENKCVNKKNNLWKRKFSEILDSEICTKWEKLRLRKFE